MLHGVARVDADTGKDTELLSRTLVPQPPGVIRNSNPKMQVPYILRRVIIVTRPTRTRQKVVNSTYYKLCRAGFIRIYPAPTLIARARGMAVGGPDVTCNVTIDDC